MIPPALFDLAAWVAESHEDRHVRIEITSDGPTYSDEMPDVVEDPQIRYTVELSETLIYSDTTSRTRDYPTAIVTTSAHSDEIEEAAALALDLLAEAQQETNP